VELLDSAYYLYAQRPLHLDEKAASLLGDGRARLVGIAEKLEAVSDWTAQGVEAVVREHAESIGAKLGQVAQPLRAALTGRATSPGLFDVMAVLGKDETLLRLRDQIKDAPVA
jgi:glutamyl-tRNA synthetase